MEPAQTLCEALDGDLPLYRLEARDYVRRLRAAVELPSSARVLDFGCGFGFVAAELASHVLEVRLWDCSARMRTLAATNTAACANVKVLEAPPAAVTGIAPFDLVLLNSVLQYVAEESVGGLLDAICPVLSTNGSIVVSDVVTADSSFARELGQLLHFGFRQRLLGDLLREYARVGRRWAAHSRQRPARRWQREDLRRWAEAASLDTEFLPANLTCRTRRLAAVMRPMRTPASNGRSLAC